MTKKDEGKSAKTGIDWNLENEANDWLKERSRGLKRGEKGFLTEEQMLRRRSKEVYTQVGVPDKAYYSGIFNRAHNPKAGCRKKDKDDLV